MRCFSDVCLMIEYEYLPNKYKFKIRTFTNAVSLSKDKTIQDLHTFDKYKGKNVDLYKKILEENDKLLPPLIAKLEILL